MHLRRLSPARAIAGLAAALVAAVVIAPVDEGPAAAQDSVPSITVEPTTGLEDGDAPVVTIKATAEHPVYEVKIRQCRAGVDYADGARNPAPDFLPAAGNCPSKPISSSAESIPEMAIDNLRGVTQEPSGAIIPYRVGSGVVEWGGDDDKQFSLQCDTDHACALVVELYGGPAGQEHTTAHVFDLVFGAADTISACGGPAAGIVTSGGSDRMSDLWIQGTLAQCDEGDGGTGALTRAVFTGEGESLSSYTAGLADMAYSALGYDEQAALVPDPSQGRESIAVPVGLNAMVLAVGGGQKLANGNRVPYTDVTLTSEEFTIFLAGGKAAMTGPIEELNRSLDIVERNVEFQRDGIFDVGSPNFQVAAGQERSTVAYMATKFAKTVAEPLFAVPRLGTFGDEQGEPRVVSSSFAQATPSYTSTLDPFSGRPILRRSLSALNRINGGPVWIFTDLATARAFGLTPVKIQLPNGDVPEPTDASLRAAVDRMDEDDQGIRAPDPGMTKQGDGPVPYPLTFVEYAMVPAQPLFTNAPACVLRPDSQDNLSTWLDFITGPGQAVLPAGMLPLPDDLADEAADRIDDVGQSEVTGPCAGKTVMPATTSTTSTSTPTTMASGGSGDGGTDGSSGGGTTDGSGSRSSRSPAGSSGSSAPADVGGVEITEEDPEIELAMPTFSGVVSGSPWRAVVSLVGIVGLTAIVTLATAGSFVPAGRRRQDDHPPARVS